MPVNLPGGLRVRRSLLACVLAASALALALPAQAYAATAVHTIISKYTHAAGFGSPDVSAMMKIADYESHDNPKVHSASCWGLFQLSTKMVAGKPWSDAAWNTKRALKYIKSRYGTPRKAWAHIKAHHWY